MSISELVLTQLKTLLGQGGFLDEPSAMKPYLAAWRNGWSGHSPLIALPSNRHHVAEIVKFCHTHKIAIVPQGGNTGLVGGAIPSVDGDEIVLNLSRLRTIHPIDKDGSTVLVEAGVVLQTLQDHAEQAGYLFPLSMASEGSAEIGGVVSTNAGGTAVLRYGTMRQLVLGLEVVLADGRIVSDLKALPKDNTGYDLSQLFVGAEGTLGVVTAMVLKLFPKPQQSMTAILALPHAEAALEALQLFRADAAEFLDAFELISSAAMSSVLKHTPSARAPFSHPHPYYLLVELSTSSTRIPLRELLEGMAEKALEHGAILDATIAENLNQAKQFWALRETISESLRQEGPGIHFDISLPLCKLAHFLSNTEQKISALSSDVLVAPFGHIGDGNLHYNMVIKQSLNSHEITALKQTIRNFIYAEVKRLEGSISAEHGIGLERKADLLNYKSPIDIEIMRSIKRTLDPDLRMNPGKIFD